MIINHKPPPLPNLSSPCLLFPFEVFSFTLVLVTPRLHIQPGTQGVCTGTFAADPSVIFFFLPFVLLLLFFFFFLFFSPCCYFFQSHQTDPVCSDFVFLFLFLFLFFFRPFGNTFLLVDFSSKVQHCLCFHAAGLLSADETQALRLKTKLDHAFMTVAVKGSMTPHPRSAFSPEAAHFPALRFGPQTSRKGREHKQKSIRSEQQGCSDNNPASTPLPLLISPCIAHHELGIKTVMAQAQDAAPIEEALGHLA